MYETEQTVTGTAARLAALRAELDGDLHLPGDAGWDYARRAWHLTIDQQPVAVVGAGSAADVAATIRAARQHGLRVAAQATGHGAGGIASLADTVLVRTDGLRGATVDPVAKIARVEAGARWEDVVGLAAEHGLAGISGSAPDVGIVGYTLGGGLGWISRSHGLAANSIVAAEIVDAEGRTRRVDAQHDEDLFWALRGGAAPVFVTALEFRLYPLARVYGGSLLWPLDRAADVVDRWREWIADVPASVTSLSRILRYPPLPDLPPFLQGRAFVAVEAAIQESAERAEELLAPLRALAPEIDTMREMSPAELGSIHGDPPTPVPAYGAGIMLAELDPGTMSAFLDAATAEGASPLLSVELRQLGGALAPGRGEGGAVSALDAEGLVYVVGITPTPEAWQAVKGAADDVVTRLVPHGARRSYRNFEERPGDPAALYGDAMERIRRVVAEWDPVGLFCGAHPVN